MIESFPRPPPSSRPRTSHRRLPKRRRPTRHHRLCPPQPRRRGLLRPELRERPPQQEGHGLHPARVAEPKGPQPQMEPRAHLSDFVAHLHGPEVVQLYEVGGIGGW
jgi:hypothetical protein